LGILFKDKYEIFFINKTEATDIRRNKEVVIKNKNSIAQYDLVITYINYPEANDELIKRMVKGNFTLPPQYSYMDSKFEKVKDNNNYKNFLTKKSADFLPELILSFCNEELCLYGYPFTMLENAEIM
jgi:hypothetical protein